MSQPKAIFGAALLGMSFNDEESVTQALDTLSKSGVKHIDTAPRYPPFEPGTSEKLLGKSQATTKGFQIDSKVLAQPGGGGELRPDSLKKSISDTLARLNTKQLDIFYCHKFDPKTPLEEQTAGLDECYKAGMFKRLGVVGFQPDQLLQFIEVATVNNRITPTVYQGEYNILTRGMEGKILPLLRSHGISYYAHCPLAAGFLTGKFTKGQHAGTRFATDHPLHHVFHERYDNAALHQAILRIDEAGAKLGMSVREVALRWIFYHSALGAEDGVITGCTTLKQIEENAESIGRGPLPEDLVRLAEEIWSSLRDGREELL